MEEKKDQKIEKEKLVFLYEALMECPNCSRRMELRVIYAGNNLFHCSTCGGLKKTASRFGFWGEWEIAQKFLKDKENEK